MVIFTGEKTPQQNKKKKEKKNKTRKSKACSPSALKCI